MWLSKLRTAVSNVKGRGAVDILMGSFFTKFAAFFGSIVLIRIMEKNEYGVLSYMENIYTYLYLLAGCGMSNAVFRYLIVKETPEEKKSVFCYVVSRGTAFNIILVCAAVVVSSLMPYSEGFSSAAALLPLMVLGIPFHYLYDVGTYSLRALFLNREFAIAAILTVVLVWGCKVALTLAGGLNGAVLSWPLAYGLSALTLMLAFCFVVFKNVEGKSLSKQDKKEMAAYSVQYMITNGLWALFLQNDLFMIGLLTGDSAAVADYKVAYVIPSAVGLLSSSIGMFVNPYFVKKERDKAWVWSKFKTVLGGTAAIVGGALLIVALFAPTLIRVLYGEQYEDIIPLMNLLLIVSFVSNGIRYVSANLLAAMGKIRFNMMVSIIGVIGQIALNAILIPRIGVYGAAVTGIAVYSMMAIAVTGYFIHVYRTG